MSGKAIFAFIMGAAVGSAVTFKLVKTKYEQLAEEEINSVREFYAKKEPEKTEEKPVVIPNTRWTTDKPNLFEYAKTIKESGYVTTDNHEEEKGGEDNIRSDIPYVITPDEYGENDDYEAASFHYYEDGVLADEWGDVVFNYEELIGSDTLESFDEDWNDVYVRNDLLKTDYEIIRTIGTYAELNSNPPVDDE
jgi:hypothetical protein